MEPSAQLLLPSALGLREYDLIEGACFLGLGERGSVVVRPTPFPTATLAVALENGRHVVRALPGTPTPLIDGRAYGGGVLEDGDRFHMGSLSVLYRAAPGSAFVESAAVASSRSVRSEAQALPAAPARDEEPARPTSAGWMPWAAWGTTLAAAVLVLATVLQSIEGLGRIRRGEERLAQPLPEPGATANDTIGEDQRSLLELARLEPASTAETIAAEMDRYERLVSRLGDPRSIAVARARLAELRIARAEAEREDFEVGLGKELAAGDYERARAMLDRFLEMHADTPTAQRLAHRRAAILADADLALEALVREVGPLVATAPREAYVRLLVAVDRFPAAQARRLEPYLATARSALHGEAPPPRPPIAPPGESGSRPPAPPTPPRDAPPEDAPPPNAGDSALAERAALQTWKTAHQDLVAGKWQAADKAYASLLRLHAAGPAARKHAAAWQEGSRIAKAGTEGAHHLLAAPAATRRGRLEVAYEFDGKDAFEQDWTIEQPFPSDKPVDVSWDAGIVRMKGGSGFMHALVYTPDVRMDVVAQAEVAHDLGLLAVAQDRLYRALLFDLGNTYFKLKKGEDARLQEGHVLWLIGQGVWSAADAEEHGFIKIAERTKSTLANGDIVRLSFQRRGDMAMGSLEGKSDAVRLEGRARGDDGSGIDAARIGAFVVGGRLNVDSIRIDGVVDAAWLDAHLKGLASLLDAPP